MQRPLTKKVILTLNVSLGLMSLGVYARTLQTPKATATLASTKKVVVAADAFLATLSPEQRKKVSFEFTDRQQRARWSNLPSGIFQRAGLRMGDLNEKQQAAVHTLLQAVLSKSGYQKVVDIINGDEVLRQTDPMAGRLNFGKAEYYVSILGTPSDKTPWMLQFGGHHLAINATLVGDKMTLAPSLPAAQPAKYTLGGKTIQPLGREMAKGFTLIQALNDEQKKQAIRAAYYIDLVLGPGQDGRKLAPEGIPATALTQSQKALLLELISEWVNNVNEPNAATKMAEIKADLVKTYFAWGGTTTTGSAAYYRVTAPTLVLEYSPQRMGGDGTGHTHCIYRDPSNDYGEKLTK